MYKIIFDIGGIYKLVYVIFKNWLGGKGLEELKNEEFWKLFLYIDIFLSDYIF